MKLFAKKSNSEESRSILSILSSDNVRESIECALKSYPAINSQIKISEDTIENAGQMVNGSADIVVLEIDLSDVRALRAIENLNKYVGISGSLIVVAQNPDTRQIRELFKMGVSDVLQPPLSENDIQSSIQFVLKNKKTSIARPAAGRVISIMKCGGGVGATMLATNLAYTISSSGKRKSAKPPKVLIIDLDIQFGNVATVLNKEGNKTNLLDLMKADERLDSSMITAAAKPITENLDLIAATNSIVPLNALTSDFLERLISLTKPFYDYIILDHPSAWSASTATSAKLSDIIIPVMKADVEHVTSARKFLEGLENLNVNLSKTYFFINNVVKGLSYKDRIANVNSITQRPSFQFYDNPKIHQQARDQGLLLHKISGSSSEQKQMSKFVDLVLAHLNSVSDATIALQGKSQPSPQLSLG